MTSTNCKTSLVRPSFTGDVDFGFFFLETATLKCFLKYFVGLAPFDMLDSSTPCFDYLVAGVPIQIPVIPWQHKRLEILG